jgi:ppGpp synthetase/RelA/SpoT-type nucleotidyltranferase
MDLDVIKKEYSKRKDKYERLKNEVIYIIKEELEAANIPYHMLEGRVKPLDSLLAKAQRQTTGQNITDIDEIVDICGVRVICLFLSDVEKIGKIIEEKFSIESKDDKVLSKPQEEFGYLSVHYIGKLPSSFCGTRYDEIKNLRFEIQLRTIAMHVWSTISHYLDYKSPHSVPSHLRKDFYSLSALFYLADSHFELFFRKGQESRLLVNKKAHDIPAMTGQEINLDTLATYLKQKFPEREHCEPDIVSDLVEELVAAGYTTIGELDTDLQRSMDAFILYEKKYPPADDAYEPIGFADVGVVRIALEILNDKSVDKAFRKYLK